LSRYQPEESSQSVYLDAVALERLALLCRSAVSISLRRPTFILP
jgi:hypothetical protein